MLDLGGKTALVTGAGRGVGEGIARQLARQGAHVLVNDIDAERATALAAELAREGQSASASAWDVSDAAAVASAIAALQRENGAIDILVNNAGNAGAQDMKQMAFSETLPADWAQFVDVNLYGVMHCTHAVLPAMCAGGWGRVITISSAAGRTGLNIGVSVYGAAKAGAINLMRHLSQEVARQGVTCNAIALGLMDNVPEEFARHIIPSIPCGRLGTAEDAGYMAGFLASEEASWISGQLFCVDGGSAPY